MLGIVLEPPYFKGKSIKKIKTGIWKIGKKVGPVIWIAGGYVTRCNWGYMGYADRESEFEASIRGSGADSEKKYS